MPNTRLGYKRRAFDDRRAPHTRTSPRDPRARRVRRAVAAPKTSRPVPIAVVDGTEISKAELDELVAQAEEGLRGAEAGVPEGGNARVPEHPDPVRRATSSSSRSSGRRRRTSASRSPTRTSTRPRTELIKSRFDGKRAEYEKALKQQGFTPEQYREKALEVSALSKKIFDEVTKDVKVTEQEILEYYTQNQSQYGTPESRDVRHILIAEKNEDGQVDFDASKAKADDIYAAAQGRRRLRSAREGELRRSRQQGLGRQADDLARPDRPRVRQDLVRARQGRALEARQDAVRLPRHRGGLRRSEGDSRRRSTRSGVDSHDAPPAEAQRGDAGVGRGPAEGLRGQGELRGRLRAAGAPRGTHRDPSRVSRR